MSISDLGKSYADQTGWFPVTSSQAYKYVFILNFYDTNAKAELQLTFSKHTKQLTII